MKMNKKKSELLFFIFILIPFFKPPCFKHFFFTDILFKGYFIINCIILMYFFLKKKFITKFNIYIIIMQVVIVLACLLNHNLNMTTLKVSIESIMLSMFVSYGFKYSFKNIITALKYILTTLILINFITICLFPGGMYVNTSSRMTANYFLGIDNIHILYILPFWFCIYLEKKIYNKFNCITLIVLLMSVLSIIMCWSATTIIGASIIGGYFLISKIINSKKIFNPITYAITYAFIWIEVIFFNIQKYFSFIIETLLKKNLSFTGRVKIWNLSIRRIIKKPFLGYGVENDALRNIVINGSHAHNFILEMLYQGGIVLLSVFIFISYLVIKKLQKFYEHPFSKFFSIALFSFFIMMIMEAYTISFVLFIMTFCYYVDIFINEYDHQKAITKRKIIVIGGNHHNILGVIRSLGENNINPYIILTNDDKYAYVKKSRYIKKYWIVKEGKEEVLNILNENFNNENEKPILIPTSDFAAKLLDDFFEELKNKYLVPNINNKSGEITKYMDKYEQYKLAKKYNILMAKTYYLDLKQTPNLENMPIPCILKPVKSVEGKKIDITICRTKTELKNAIKKFINLNYKEILLQEFLYADKEFDLCGCVKDNIVIFPAIIDKLRLYPDKRGNTSFGSVIDSNFADLNNIKYMLSKLNYNGIINIEVFVVNGRIYLNEINFRNSAISYALTSADIYIPLIWLQLNIDNYQSCNYSVKQYYFIGEDNETKSLLHNDVTFFEYLYEFIISKKFIFLNLEDIKPFFYKIVYGIRKKIKNRF